MSAAPDVRARPGKVWLVGAGPGDPELLTLKAVRALREADVLLVDDLVSRDVLDFARPGARVLHVGKRGGCPSAAQDFIERLMVRYARRGAVVARVKGGDPFVFGRGGEELAALARAGIPAEAVNGVTAGIAAPSALGIPVTHRDCVRGVTLVTGHTRDGVPPNWEALARTGTTLVIYMGVAGLEATAQALIDAGLAASTPVAVIQSATRADQKAVISDLRAVAAEVRAAGIGSPAVIVVGDVVKLARASAVAPALRIALGG